MVESKSETESNVTYSLTYMYVISPLQPRVD